MASRLRGILGFSMIQSFWFPVSVRELTIIQASQKQTKYQCTTEHSYTHTHTHTQALSQSMQTDAQDGTAGSCSQSTLQPQQLASSQQNLRKRRDHQKSPGQTGLEMYLGSENSIERAYSEACSFACLNIGLQAENHEPEAYCSHTALSCFSRV